MSELRIEMVNCEWTILNEIEQGCAQKSVAMTYGFGLLSSEELTMDWRKINRAIIDRWSLSGLDRVKKMAWKHVKGATAMTALQPTPNTERN